MRTNRIRWGCRRHFSKCGFWTKTDRDLPPGEVGEICGRGPILMPGYYKRPDLTEEAIKDGWLHSGDMGYVDEDGFLYLVDRKKDMIIPAASTSIPGISKRSWFSIRPSGRPRSLGCRTTNGVKRPWPPSFSIHRRALTLKKLKKWVNERVGAKFQRVHEVVIMADFPRNVAGKTLKREMRDKYGKANDPKFKEIWLYKKKVCRLSIDCECDLAMRLSHDRTDRPGHELGFTVAVSLAFRLLP